MARKSYETSFLVVSVGKMRWFEPSSIGYALPRLGVDFHI